MKLNVDQAIRRASTLAAKGRKADAEKLYREVLERFPANRRALDGLRALGQGQTGAATDHFHRGNALMQARQLQGAVASYDRALALKPDFFEAHNNRGNALKDLGLQHEALASYDAVIRLQPGIAVAHFNRGNVLRTLRRLEEAVASYAAALRLNPQFADACNNRGFALQELGRLEEAVASYDQALKLKPDFAAAFSNRGSALQELRRPIEAIASYATALRLKPDFGAALVQMLHQKAMICDWTPPPRRIELGRLDIAAAPIPPTQVLAIADDPPLQLEVAKAWARTLSPAGGPAALRPSAPGEKLRIGYFSADFYDHATMFLMARLFEVHDRGRFEVHAFSYGPDRQDTMQRRLTAAVDRFHDVRNLGDPEVAELARRQAIDVAVDLKGYTLGTRPGIFANRAAPVQINYLGYPGSMGADFIDYIVADPVVVPPDRRQSYSEKVITLPGSYQVNDDRRAIASRTFTRAELGLPERGFVFCCFNNNYKISPAEFAIWMRLLGKVEGSVLWLFEGDALVKANLAREAETRGVDPGRLVFAAKMPNAEHLARQACADLFLDTFNYNAHTTASDALWAGLPVVTKAGNSFAARVAASLLMAVGLPELVTSSPEAYERLALELATDPDRLAAIKAKLAANRLTTPLFDSERFARHIERAYELAFQRCVEGLPPDHIEVEPA
jgi:predicted O-linked N-acetylglucosamine transferase (SPINDLY family)